MYVPAHFDESRADVLHALIEKNPLGVLVTNGKSGLDANHIRSNWTEAKARLAFCIRMSHARIPYGRT
jgi:predicted FMN-binding regulatory protein PaiB